MIIRILRSLLTIVMMLVAFVVFTQALTPIYRFGAPRAFSGAYVYNPYAGCDSAAFAAPLKSNFHAHTMWDTRHDYTPEEFRAAYLAQDYEVIGIAEHQVINPMGHIPSYEHGLNLSNFHVLMLGADGVQWLDYPIMLMPLNQMQASLDMLSGDAQAMGINHSERIKFIDHQRIFSRLQGYKLMEMNPMSDPRCWDYALSSGIYSNLVADDDAHSIINRRSWFQKCYTMVLSDSEVGDILVDRLVRGAAYGVVLSNEKNTEQAPHAGLPRIKDIGITAGDTVYIALDMEADSIRFVGDNGRTVALFADCDNARYAMRAADSYVRVECYYSPGIEVWSNPFVRTEQPLGFIDDRDGMPRTVVPAPTINWWLTVLNSIMWTSLAGCVMWLTRRMKLL